MCVYTCVNMCVNMYVNIVWVQTDKTAVLSNIHHSLVGGSYISRAGKRLTLFPCWEHSISALPPGTSVFPAATFSTRDTCKWPPTFGLFDHAPSSAAPPPSTWERNMRRVHMYNGVDNTHSLAFSSSDENQTDVLPFQPSWPSQSTIIWVLLPSPKNSHMGAITISSYAHCVWCHEIHVCTIQLQCSVSPFNSRGQRSSAFTHLPLSLNTEYEA